jgi:hypothetical protein
MGNSHSPPYGHQFDGLNMFAICSKFTGDNESVRFLTLRDGRTVTTNSVTFAAIFAEEYSNEIVKWTVCVLPDHLPLTCPFNGDEVVNSSTKQQ